VHGADAWDVKVLSELVEAALESVAGRHELLDVVDAREERAEDFEEAALLGCGQEGEGAGIRAGGVGGKGQ
jgi:hypothetical protein